MADGSVPGDKLLGAYDGKLADRSKAWEKVQFDINRLTYGVKKIKQLVKEEEAQDIEEMFDADTKISMEKRLNLESYVDELEDKMKKLMTEKKAMDLTIEKLKGQREQQKMRKEEIATQRANLGHEYERLGHLFEGKRHQWLNEREKHLHYLALSNKLQHHKDESLIRWDKYTQNLERKKDSILTFTGWQSAFQKEKLEKALAQSEEDYKKEKIRLEEIIENTREQLRCALEEIERLRQLRIAAGKKMFENKIRRYTNPSLRQKSEEVFNAWDSAVGQLHAENERDQYYAIKQKLIEERDLLREELRNQQYAVRQAEDATRSAISGSERMQEILKINQLALEKAHKAWETERGILMDAINAAREEGDLRVEAALAQAEVDREQERYEAKAEQVGLLERICDLEEIIEEANEKREEGKGPGVPVVPRSRGSACVNCMKLIMHRSFKQMAPIDIPKHMTDTGSVVQSIANSGFQDLLDPDGLSDLFASNKQLARMLTGVPKPQKPKKKRPSTAHLARRRSSDESARRHASPEVQAAEDYIYSKMAAMHSPVRQRKGADMDGLNNALEGQMPRY